MSDASAKAGDVHLTLVARPLPLTVPYVLSFAALDAFDTYYVVAEQGGRRGWGEATVLPGYGGEDAATLRREFARVTATMPPSDAAPALRVTAPFLASAVSCALETLGHEGVWSGLERAVPLAAFCAGDTPVAAAANASRLAAEGFRVLKLKIGRDGYEEDLARVRAVSNAVPRGVTLRLDANQALSEEAAAGLAKGLEDLPVALLEQPFAPDAWAAHERLIEQTRVPIMLDESIWSENDIDRAAAIGARFVKFKLAKHGGMEHTRRMIRRAQEHGLGVVLGNGVQSAIGNHLEARLHVDTGIDTAGEFNGFAKVSAAARSDRMGIASGKLRCGDLEPDLVVKAGRAERAVQSSHAQVVAPGTA